MGCEDACWLSIHKVSFFFYEELIAAMLCVQRQTYFLCLPPLPLFLCVCSVICGIYVTVIYVKMPQCNFSDETIN